MHYLLPENLAVFWLRPLTLLTGAKRGILAKIRPNFLIGGAGWK